MQQAVQTQRSLAAAWQAPEHKVDVPLFPEEMDWERNMKGTMEPCPCQSNGTRHVWCVCRIFQCHHHIRGSSGVCLSGTLGSNRERATQIKHRKERAEKTSVLQPQKLEVSKATVKLTKHQPDNQTLERSLTSADAMHVQYVIPLLGSTI